MAELNIKGRSFLTLKDFTPEEILYLGDTSVDVTCARRAGMHAVGVTWGFRERQELEEAGAEYIIDRPEETLRLIATIL